MPNGRTEYQRHFVIEPFDLPAIFPFALQPLDLPAIIFAFAPQLLDIPGIKVVAGRSSGCGAEGMMTSGRSMTQSQRELARGRTQ